MERTQPKEPFPILAIDYGERYTGLAWSPDGITPLPLEVVETIMLAEKISHIIAQKKIQHLVWGLPVNQAGVETPLSALITKIAQELSSLPYTLVNERYSSQQTIASARERRDDLAAMNILEFYLDQKDPPTA